MGVLDDPAAVLFSFKLSCKQWENGCGQGYLFLSCLLKKATWAYGCTWSRKLYYFVIGRSSYAFRRLCSSIIHRPRFPGLFLCSGRRSLLLGKCLAQEKGERQIYWSGNSSLFRRDWGCLVIRSADKVSTHSVRCRTYTRTCCNASTCSNHRMEKKPWGVA